MRCIGRARWQMESSGLWYPWLIKSETLHYGYALVMLIFLWVLRKGFTGLSRKWWTVALVIQFWHHIEHLLLIGQATFHHNLWGKPVPCSVLQLVFPRVELHLFYNSIVFIPMVIAMYYHMFPPQDEPRTATCSCEWHRGGRSGLRLRRIQRVLWSFAVLLVFRFFVVDRLSSPHEARLPLYRCGKRSSLSLRS